MTRRRISKRTPRELTAKERSALSDVVLELDSDFRVKTGSVDDVSQVLPESGVIVLNELDGRLYAADKYGWHRFGDPYGPVNLFVDFNGTDQFEFVFEAPITSTLEIHDGDGTVTQVAGNDSTAVIHTTNYAAAGVYTFTVVGDVYDILNIAMASKDNVYGAINGWAQLPGLNALSVANSPYIYGNLELFKDFTSIAIFGLGGSLVVGDISYLAGNPISHINCVGNRLIHGDLSSLAAIPATIIILKETSITFDKVSSGFANANYFRVNDCNWTPIMVDKCLMTLAAGGVSGATELNLGGNNAKRTAASDDALATLIAAGNTVIVNQ